VPAGSLGEFVAFVRQQPGEVTVAAVNRGNSVHLAAQMFATLVGAPVRHVFYSAGPAALADLLGARIHAMFPGLPAVLGLIRAGKLRPLAALSRERLPQLPEVPTAAEQGLPDLVFETWFGLLAPKGTPQPIIARLNQEINASLDDPASAARWLESGILPAGGMPQALADLIRRERAVHAELVRDAGFGLD